MRLIYGMAAAAPLLVAAIDPPAPTATAPVVSPPPVLDLLVPRQGPDLVDAIPFAPRATQPPAFAAPPSVPDPVAHALPAPEIGPDIQPAPER